MAQKEGKALKTRLLQVQEGKCAVCRRSEFLFRLSVRSVSRRL